MSIPPELIPSLIYGSGVLTQAAAALPELLTLGSDSSATRPRLQGQLLTVLQPILGGDPALEDCLFETAMACAPSARFVWLIDEDDSLGQAAAQLAHDRLTPAARAAVEIRRVPPVEVLAHGATTPLNPKSTKLAQALDDVSTAFVAVLDDDTTVGPEHLARALRTLGNEAALYTGLPSYRVDSDTHLPVTGSALVAGFVNSSAARTYLAALRLGPPATINGMFWVTRTETLRGLGGFDAIREELCDDLAIADLYRDAGLSIVQGATAQVLVTRGLTLRAHLARMHRWFVFARVLLVRAGWGVRLPLLVFGLGLPLALATTLLVAGTSRNAALAAGATLVLRHAVLSVLLACSRDPSLVARTRLPIVSSVLAEIMLPLHAVHAAFVPMIVWRTRRYRVGPTGRFAEVTDA